MSNKIVRHFIPFFALLGLAWMVGCARQQADSLVPVSSDKGLLHEEVDQEADDEEEVLQAGQMQSPQLALYKDSFYNTLYHADLTQPSLKKAAISIQWEVQGGRYHIYEEEMPLFKTLRPFQRTILFLEKNKYTVFVTLIRHGYEQETNHIDIDLSKVMSQTPLKSEIEIDKLSALPGEAIKLHAKVENSGSFHYQWEAKKLQKVKCPSLEDVLPEVIQSELTTIHEICDRSYEETMGEGKDYLLEAGQTADNIEVIFKAPGKYAVYCSEYDDQGEILSKSSRKIILDSHLVSRR